MLTSLQVSQVTCHISRVTFHMSHVPCNMSHDEFLFYIYFVFDKVLELVGGESVIKGAHPVQFLHMLPRIGDNGLLYYSDYCFLLTLLSTPKRSASPEVTSPSLTSPPVTSPPVTSPPVTSPPVTSPPAELQKEQIWLGTVKLKSKEPPQTFVLKILVSWYLEWANCKGFLEPKSIH